MGNENTKENTEGGALLNENGAWVGIGLAMKNTKEDFCGALRPDVK